MRIDIIVVLTSIKNYGSRLHEGYKRVFHSLGPFSQWQSSLGIVTRAKIGTIKALDLTAVPFRPEGTYLERSSVRLYAGFADFEKSIREALRLPDPKAAIRRFQIAFDLTGIYNPQHDDILRIGRESLEAFLGASPAQQIKFYERFKKSGFGYTYQPRYVNVAALLVNLLKGKEVFDFSEAQKYAGHYHDLFAGEWLRHGQPFALRRIDEVLQRLQAGSLSLCDIGPSCKIDGSPTLNLLKHVLALALGQGKLDFHGVDQVRNEYWDIKERRFVLARTYQRIGEAEYLQRGISYHDYTVDKAWDLNRNPLPRTFDIITCSNIIPVRGKARHEMPKTVREKMLLDFLENKLDVYEKDDAPLPTIVDQGGNPVQISVVGREGAFLANILASLKDGGILIATPFFLKNISIQRGNCDAYWIIQRQGEIYMILDLTLPYQNDPRSRYGHAEKIWQAKKIEDEKIDNSYTRLNKGDFEQLLRIGEKIQFLEYLEANLRESFDHPQDRDCAKVVKMVFADSKDDDIKPFLYILLKDFMGPAEVQRIYNQAGLPGIEKAVDQILAGKGLQGFAGVIFDNV